MPMSSKQSLLFTFSNNNFYAYIFTPIHTTCLNHFILLGLIPLIIFGKMNKSWSSSLYSFLWDPCYFHSHRSKCLSTLFLNTFTLCSSLKVRDQFFHPCRTPGKIIILCILMFMFLGNMCEGKRFWTEW
jgi:hypothetical protein